MCYRSAAIMSRHILITGGAGFIGYHLARHLLEKTSDEVVLTDNLQRGRMDQDLQDLLDRYATRVRFVQADLTDPAAWAAFDRNVDHVYHLAAVNGTKYFYEIPHKVMRTNMLTLIHGLDWVASLEQKPKLLFPSSCEAYAGAMEAFHQLPLPTPENVPLVIADPYNPRASYDVTKLASEPFVIHYARQYGFPAVIIRPHNFYGPRAGWEHVIPEFSERIRNRIDLFQIFGGDDTRTFCYIEDAVEAMRMLMESPKTDGQPIETVHIGNTDEISMVNLAKTFFDVAGWQPTQLDVKQSPPGSVKRRLADISKIKQLIDWEPRTSLKDGLKKTLDWYAAHPKP